ncbi:type II secretion system F family protein [Agromyces larvae]|uniref:Type II secretion system F family protein n=1 Tax=Agromyces larvae TaxID=2929802 RepID=A0ABY4C3H1_9MICO|nr:type II secretion system F family protein [Agromyces larvae]UOE45539.1 type II secretion system F family protein [Agromyces larvae]
MTVAAAALALGAALGAGLWLMLSAVPRLGRPRLMERVAPYVADLSSGARDLLDRRPADPAPVLGLVAAPVVEATRSAVAAIGGGDEVIVKRLRQAGSTTTVAGFRGQQLASAVIGFVVAGALAVASPGFATMPTIARIVVPFVVAALAAVGRDWLLQHAAARRQARISAELPTVLEFLALSLTAGEGMLDALRRVARAGSGELPREFAGVIAAVGTGVPLADALAELRDALDHPALTRAVDQILGALDRGAPLAAVLTAQAGDAREEAKRRIIELAGRKEIAMLVPLIFLILPITVAFALFPGYVVLQTGF